MTTGASTAVASGRSTDVQRSDRERSPTSGRSRQGARSSATRREGARPADRVARAEQAEAAWRAARLAAHDRGDHVRRTVLVRRPEPPGQAAEHWSAGRSGHEWRRRQLGLVHHVLAVWRASATRLTPTALSPPRAARPPREQRAVLARRSPPGRCAPRSGRARRSRRRRSRRAGIPGRPAPPPARGRCRRA